MLSFFKNKSQFLTIAALFLTAAVSFYALFRIGGKVPKDLTPYKIVLKADKKQIKSDGIDKIKFTVYIYNKNNERLNGFIPMDYSIYINGVPLKSNYYTSTEICESKAYAEYKKIKSNEINFSQILSTNLPLIVMWQTNKKAETDKYAGRLTLYDSKNGRNSVMDSPVIDQNIVYSERGKWSVTFPKKQYNIRFIDDFKKEIKFSVLNMPKDSEWVLNAPYADKTLIKNFLAYTLGGQILEAKTDCRLVEVYMDTNYDGKLSENEYYGVYLLTEKIKRSNLNIEEAGNNITGGYIIARDKTDKNDVYFTLPSEIYSIVHGKAFPFNHKLVYPSKANITDEQLEYIKNYITNLNDKIHVLTDGINDYKDYLDINSYIDCVLINEIFRNPDGFEFSTFFYKNVNGKLMSGPLWDFDIAGGTLLRKDGDYDNPEGFQVMYTEWTYYMLKDPVFVSAVIERYKNMRKTVFSDKNVISLIDETVKYIDSGAVKRNFSRFPELFNGQYNKSLNNIFADTRTYDEEINLLKNFLVNRLKWLDENIGSLCFFDKYRLDK